MTERVDPDTGTDTTQPAARPLIPCKFCGQDIVASCSMIDATALVASILSALKGGLVTVSGTILLQMQPVACPYCRRPYAEIHSTSDRVLPASGLPLVQPPGRDGGGG